MTLTLELTRAQETLLLQRAAEAGQEPGEYLLVAAGITVNLDSSPNTIDNADTASAYDLFRGLLGGFSSGGANLSEGTGAAFAEGMAAKRNDGHL